MAREKPKIDPRKFSDLLALLKQRLPHYTPEWPGTDDQDSGVALLKLFSHLTESVIKRLNQTPHQNLVAFLRMLGIKLLPAEPSRVPVRFKLVAGTSNEVLVPQRTQTTSAATDTRPELPFETEEDLFATPSPLASVFSLDPEKDAIYQPPLGFLERETPDTSAVAYALISFSRAGSNTLQLDHTDNLGKGDLLKLVSTTAMSSAAAETCVCPALSEESEATATAVAEYVPIAEIKGTIVVLTTKLMRDYAPGTPVEKITKFHVFESRNLQEHILYLGHKDLFNVKSPVLFTLNITLMAGTEQGLEPLQLAWEYWGEIKGQEGTDWQAFTVEFDGSQGLSQNGDIQLLKATEGEIKELEVNSIKNRWMRAKLQEPLPANATRRLPVLDNISFLVESAGAALPPDQAFHNDTPLDVNLPFYPLGLEPRLFDKFQLASKEVFSKKGAEVKMYVRLDPIGTLAAPTAVLDENYNRRIFARGTRGRLIELKISQVIAPNGTAKKEHIFIDHGYPVDSPLALPDRDIGTEATPSAISVQVNNGEAIIAVFAKAESGQLVERLIRVSESSWIIHPLPPNEVKVKFDPSAVLYKNGVIKVCAVGEDGNLYILVRDYLAQRVSWQSEGKPFGVPLNSSPYAVIFSQSDPAPEAFKVFVKGNDEKLYEWQEWVGWMQYPADSPIVDSSPFALPYSNSGSEEVGLTVKLTGTAESQAYRNLRIKIIAPSPSNLVQEYAIRDYNGSQRLASLEGAFWIKAPDNGFTFEIALSHTSTVQDADLTSIKLDQRFAKEAKGIYEDVTITVVDVLTRGVQIRKITEYEGYWAKVDTAWNPVPIDSTRPFRFLYFIDNLRGRISESTGSLANSKVYVRGHVIIDDGVVANELWELNTGAAGKQWRSLQSPAALGAPFQQTRVASHPHGFVEEIGSQPGKIHVFVRGTDNRLWEMTAGYSTDTPAENGTWIPHQSPGLDVNLVHSPFALALPESRHYAIYSSSNQNAILEKEIRVTTGSPQVGTNFSFTLADSASAALFDFVNDTYHIKMKAGKLSTELRKVTDTKYDEETQVVHITPGWDWDPANPDAKPDPTVIPDSSSIYGIGKQIHSGLVQGDISKVISLADDSSEMAGAYDGLGITLFSPNGTSRSNKISQYKSGSLKLAEVENAWEKIPDSADRYQLDLDHSGVPKDMRSASLLLDPNAASSNDDAYNGMKITIAQKSYTIVSYVGGDQKEASLDKNLDVAAVPPPGDAYEITTEIAEPKEVTDAFVVLSGAADINNAYNGLEISVFGGENLIQSKKVKSYVYNAQTKSGKAIIAGAWATDDVPTNKYTYQFRELVHRSKPAGEGTPRTIVLDPEKAVKNEGAYVNLEVKISRTDENHQVIYEDFATIEKYSIEAGSAIAVVNKTWKGKIAPDHTYDYEVYYPDPLPKVKAADLPTITLKEAAPHAKNPLQGISVTINESPIKHKIFSYDPPNRLARISDGWELPLGQITRYRLKDEGQIETAISAFIELDPQIASQNEGAYDGVTVIVSESEKNIRQENFIVLYREDELTNKLRAFVRDNWLPELLPLGKNHTYEIKADLKSPRGPLIQLDDLALQDFSGMEIVVYDDPAKKPQLRTVQSYDPQTKFAIVDSNWEAGRIPPSGSTFLVINYKNADGIVFHEGIAQVGGKKTITLDNNAISDAERYRGKRIDIISGPGLPNSNRITDYLPGDRIAKLEDAWLVKPDTTSKYIIEEAPVLENWTKYEETNALPITPQLSWEYWNSRGWVVFKGAEHKFIDETKNFSIDGGVSFVMPDDIEPTEISGQENYWIRARIVGGDYGRETYILEERVKGADPDNQDITKETKLVPVKSTIQPPIINSLSITYELKINQFPDRCLTYNNLDYIDQTDACITTDKRFSPFVPLEGQVAEEDECGIVLKTAAGVRAQVIAPTQLGKAIYLGFANARPNGSLKIFFAAKELPYSDASKPKMEWSYRAENEWKRLSFDDDTEGLIKEEILQFTVPKDFTAARRFGAILQHWWIRGMLTEGQYEETPVLGGIYPNTTWAFQAETRRDEILGSSNGEAGQAFRFFRFPVREGQVVRVREVLTEEEKEELIKLFGEQALHEVKDELGKVLETWVLWTEVENFFDSNGTDRHYTLDRATGELRFGDGRNGQIPPAGLNNLRAFSYQAGGGAVGNVEAGAIQSLTTAIANVEAVINPVAAGGGSDTATLDEMLTIGPAMINHRQRAVTPQDFEWLAKQASRQVAKARCVRNLDSQGRRATGWVTLYLVPHSRDSEPQPSLEMRRMVQRYVAEHCANTVAAPQHIFVEGPVYAEIDVLADLVVDTIDAAARVEQEARAKLADFLHPLTGGPTVAGWEFGQGLSASDVYVLLEKIEGLDHVENLSFSRAGVAYTDLVTIGANELVAGGTLRINVTAKTGA